MKPPNNILIPQSKPQLQRKKPVVDLSSLSAERPSTSVGKPQEPIIFPEIIKQPVVRPFTHCISTDEKEAPVNLPKIKPQKRPDTPYWPRVLYRGTQQAETLPKIDESHS
jgi:hypothetical protein